jgi:2-aminoadipate transaminase
VDYTDLFTKNMPAEVVGPPGQAEDTRFTFSVTYTDRDTMPVEGFVDALADIMPREGVELAKYPPSQGHVGLREYIARALHNNRGMDVPVDNIFLTAGAGGAVGTILDAFIDAGDTVLVEEFCYSGTLGMLLGKRANVVHIKSDANGMDTDALEEAVKDLVAKGTHPKLIYTISVYQNPMGMTLSAERRKHMVEISQTYGIPILENESYADFRIDGDPLPQAMYGIDDQDGVSHVSAYTKLLGCGLRLGFGVVPDQVKEVVGKLRFGSSPSHLTSMAVYEYLRQNGDEYIEAVARSLGTKRDAMLAALGEHFPPSCEWSNPHGGMMLWGRLPEGADTWNMLEKAVEAGVKYNPGAVYRATRSPNNYMRLTYSYHSTDEIAEGIEILAGVFEREGVFDNA